jgi:GNAT superfamily N-acetyltransferase
MVFNPLSCPAMTDRMPSGANDELDDRCAWIEQAFVNHWRHFGLYPGANLRDEDGVLWFESPIKHLPYNAVLRTTIPGGTDTDAVVARIATTFRARDVPFLWVHRPSDRPSDLDRHLATHGLDLVETATGMDLDLDGWQPEPNQSDAVFVDIANDETGLQDYEELIRTYWSVPESERHMIQALNRHWTGERTVGLRLVAYLGGQPVGKLFMNTEELPARVSFYGVAVKAEARGHGVATGLMKRPCRSPQPLAPDAPSCTQAPWRIPCIAGWGSSSAVPSPSTPRDRSSAPITTERAARSDRTTRPGPRRRRRCVPQRACPSARARRPPRLPAAGGPHRPSARR